MNRIITTEELVEYFSIEGEFVIEACRLFKENESLKERMWFMTDGETLYASTDCFANEEDEDEGLCSVHDFETLYDGYNWEIDTDDDWYQEREEAGNE